MANDDFKPSQQSLANIRNAVSMKTPKKVTTSAFENTQMLLFQDFLCNKEEERDKLSNTILLWDSVPKYSTSKVAMNGKRQSNNGRLGILKQEFKFGGKIFNVKISPARIEEIDKQTGQICEIDYYPSANEELVEDALRKLSVDQNQGFFDRGSARSGVVFSLYMLREELKKRGHTRSFSEIRLSLTILAKANIEIIHEDHRGVGFGLSPILPALAGVTRKQYEENSNAKWVAQFHPLVTQSIEDLSYHQFNYDKMMRHTSQLSRWIHRLLSIKFNFAATGKTFDINYSTIKRDSRLLEEYKFDRQAVVAVEKALEELKKNKVLLIWEKKHVERGARGKILDAIYTLHANPEFISEVKAANKRLGDSKDVLINSTVK